jgi:hypothetical protein
VEELLAGRALGGLDPEDAELAERAMVEHVPGCPRCRRTLDAFNAVAGDLALVADPVPTPEVLDGRVRRSVRRRNRRSAGWALAAAASVVALALGGWNLALTTRLSDAEVVAEAAFQSAHPQNTVVPLSGPGPETASMVYVHGQERMYLVASGLPDPRGVYRVWCLGDEGPWSPGTLEPDERGRAVLEIETDPARWRVVMVTDEPDEEGPAPASSPLVSATVE